jgi:PAS domain S-box-containing protein
MAAELLRKIKFGVKSRKTEARSRRTASRMAPSMRRPRIPGQNPDAETLREQHQALLSAQAALEGSRARYAELYDSAPVGFLTLSPSGIIDEMNLACARLLGTSRTRAVKLPLAPHIARRDRKKFFKFLSQQRRKPGRASVELEIERRDELVVELVVEPAAPDGSPQFQCALINVTARRQAESDLRASEEKFRTLTSHAPVGIFFADQHGDTTFVNEAWSELTGLPASHALGRLWVNAVHPDDRASVSDGWKEAVRKGVPSETEFRFQRPDGEVVWVHGKAAPLKNGIQLMGFVGSVADITERKNDETALQAAEAHFRSMADTAPVMIWMADGAKSGLWFNKRWLEFVGEPMEQQTGDGWFSHVHPQDREDCLAKYHSSFDRREPFQLECRLRRHDGEFRWILTNGIPSRDASGKFNGFIGSCMDITAQKLAEIQLASAHHQVLAASRAKDDFLAMLSHELRTPLNPVLLTASEAARNPDLPPRVRADFDAIRKNIELEARLIEDLLDITRVSRGKLLLNLEPVNVHAVLRDAIAKVQEEIDRKRIALIPRLSAEKTTVSGDAVRLQQVFWNVLKNAVKFTPGEGTIFVETENVDSTLAVKISDTGIGMTREDLSRIFEAFSQRAPGSFGGLGLGLAISQKLVELHHGVITADSDGKDRGAAFVIELPLLRQAKKSHAAENVSAGQMPLPWPEKKPAHAIRILLVEDHEPTRAALVSLLVRRNYKVEAAGTLAEARALAKGQDFNLLISDIGLPDGSGYDLMREFRQHSSAAGIALTGYGTEEDVHRSQEAGFITHLTKPVRVESLETALAAALKAAERKTV